MAHDPCKECIDRAKPVTPDPIDKNVSGRRVTWAAEGRMRLFEPQAAREDPVLTQALTLLHWAIDQRRQGRVILSGDPTNGQLQRLHMPALEQMTIEQKR